LQKKKRYALYLGSHGCKKRKKKSNASGGLKKTNDQASLNERIARGDFNKVFISGACKRGELLPNLGDLPSTATPHGGENPADILKKGHHRVRGRGGRNDIGQIKRKKTRSIRGLFAHLVRKDDRVLGRRLTQCKSRRKELKKVKKVTEKVS